MKKLIIYFGLILFFHSILESKNYNPDSGTLEKSKDIYPYLLKKFKNNDTTLSKDDYANLYFGAVFQKNYDEIYIDALAIFLKNIIQNYKNYSSDEIKRINKDLINRFPVSLTTSKYLFEIYKLIGDSVQSKIHRQIYLNLIEVVKSSLDSASKEQFYYINCIGDAEEYVKNIYQNDNIIYQIMIYGEKKCMINVIDSNNSAKYIFNLKYVKLPKKVETPMISSKGPKKFTDFLEYIFNPFGYEFKTSNINNSTRISLGIGLSAESFNCKQFNYKGLYFEPGIYKDNNMNGFIDFELFSVSASINYLLNKYYNFNKSNFFSVAGFGFFKLTNFDNYKTSIDYLSLNFRLNYKKVEPINEKNTMLKLNYINMFIGSDLNISSIKLGERFKNLTKNFNEYEFYFKPTILSGFESRIFEYLNINGNISYNPLISQNQVINSYSYNAEFALSSLLFFKNKKSIYLMNRFELFYLYVNYSFHQFIYENTNFNIKKISFGIRIPDFYRGSLSLHYTERIDYYNEPILEP